MRLWDYPWKKRLGSLVGVSLAIWLLFRPAYWPFPAFGDAPNVEGLKRANQLVWMIVVLASICVADAIAMVIACRRNADAKISAFWPAMGAVLLAKTWIDFTFIDRPLPVGSEQFFVYERWVDIAAIASLPVVYMIAIRVGPPSQWSIVLQPPATTADASDSSSEVRSPFHSDPG